MAEAKAAADAAARLAQARYLVNSVFRCSTCMPLVTDPAYGFDQHAPPKRPSASLLCCAYAFLDVALDPYLPKDLRYLIHAYSIEHPSVEFLTTPPLPAQGSVRAFVVQNRTKFEMYLEFDDALMEIKQRHLAAAKAQLDKVAVAVEKDVREVVEDKGEGEEKHDPRDSLDYERFFPCPCPFPEDVASHTKSLAGRTLKQHAERVIQTQKSILLFTATSKRSLGGRFSYDIQSSNSSVKGSVRHSWHGNGTFTCWQHAMSFPNVEEEPDVWRSLCAMLIRLGPQEKHEVAHVTYTRNDKSHDVPRTIQLYLPQRLFAHQSGLGRAHYKQGPESSVDYHENTKPTYHDEMGCFALHFDQHRIRQKSSKNFKFQRKTAADGGNVTMMQFGRVLDRSTFVLDYAYPLSPFTAFCIALTAMNPALKD